MFLKALATIFLVIFILHNFEFCTKCYGLGKLVVQAEIPKNEIRINFARVILNKLEMILGRCLFHDVEEHIYFHKVPIFLDHLRGIFSKLLRKEGTSKLDFSHFSYFSLSTSK